MNTGSFIYNRNTSGSTRGATLKEKFQRRNQRPLPAAVRICGWSNDSEASF